MMTGVQHARASIPATPVVCPRADHPRPPRVVDAHPVLLHVITRFSVFSFLTNNVRTLRGRWASGARGRAAVSSHRFPAFRYQPGNMDTELEAWAT